VAAQSEHEQSEHEQRVTPLELFFDLVFVFAITQVTSLLAAMPTWTGVLHGMLVLTALWWAWAAYAWLTNTVDSDEGVVRIAMLGAMAAMLVVSLAVPEAFGDDAVLFAGAYIVVRALHLVLYAIAGKHDPELLGAVLRLASTATIGPLLLLVAGFLEGGERVAVWILALTLDFLGPTLIGRGRGWRVSVEHFAERHALIILIALGESIVAIGVGATSITLDLGVVVAAVFAITLVSALWWLYFDVAAIIARELVRSLSGLEQIRTARDAYSYLHLPMVAGIVLFALGLKKTLEDVGEPLDTVPAVALAGGVALYLLAHCAFFLRLARRLFRRRFIGGVVLLALIPAVTRLPALASLALVGAVCVFVVAYEAISHREHRAQIRHPELADRELVAP
jgi:low temperature requirement protein LtrA